MSTWKQSSGFQSSAMFPAIASQVAEATAATSCRTVVFSAEGISYLRFDDELERLRTLLGGGQIRIVIYQRAMEEWIKSFKAQISTHNSFSADKDAFNYVEPDSWLFDFAARIETFRRVFGSANVAVVDYDYEVCAKGSVIPSFLNYIGCHSLFDATEWSGIWENRRAS